MSALNDDIIVPVPKCFGQPRCLRKLGYLPGESLDVHPSTALGISIEGQFLALCPPTLNPVSGTLKEINNY